MSQLFSSVKRLLSGRPPKAAVSPQAARRRAAEDAIDRATTSVVERLEGRQMFTAVVYPTIGVSYGSNAIANHAAIGDVSTATGTDFGTVDTRHSLQETFTIKNTGAGVLNLTAYNRVQISGANAADFSVVAQPAGLVNPNATTTFKLKFAPTTAAQEQAVVTIPNDTTGSNPFTFVVDGTGSSVAHIAIKGNGKAIANGDAAYSTTDFTNMGGTESSAGTITKSFSVTNTGSDTVTFGGSAVTVSGADAAKFSVSQPLVSSLAPAASTTFTVTYAPNGSTATNTTTVNVASNDPATPYTFNVEGNGQALPVSAVQGGTNNVAITNGDTTPDVSDATEFGAVELTAGSANHTFAVVNNGSGNLTFTGANPVAITGADAANFTVVSQPSGPVAPGTNATFALKFTPRTSGIHTATVTIADNDHAYSFAVKGNALLQPKIDVLGGTGTNAVDIAAGSTNTASAAMTDFGTVDTATTSPGVTHTFTIKNVASAPLHLGGYATPNVSITGANAADFSIVAQPTVTTIAPPGAPHAAPAPPAAVPTAHFHHIVSHKTMLLRGPDHVAVSTAAPTPTPTPAPVTSTTFQVKYHPTGTGAGSATLTVNNDDPNTPSYAFALSGVGAQTGYAVIKGNNVVIASGDTNTVAADFTNYGTVDANATVTKNFSLSNIGAGTLTYTGATVAVTSNDSGWSATPPSDPTLASGSNTTFALAYHATGAGDTGAHVGHVVVTSDDPNTPSYTFDVKATVTNAATVSLAGGTASAALTPGNTPATADGSDFGTVELSTGSVQDTFVLTNSGSANMTFNATAANRVTFAGTNPKDFTLVTPLPASLPAGGTAAVTVQFKPKDSGSRSATMSIASNDPAGAFAINLKGTASRLGEVVATSGTNTLAFDHTDTPSVALGTDFGSVDALKTQTRTFTIKNNGSDALNLGNTNGAAVVITQSGTASAYFSVPSSPRVSLAPGASTSFPVLFTPAGLTNNTVENAVVTINSDAANHPSYAFNITANAVTVPLAQVSSNSHVIPTGDTKPLTTDNTDLGSATVTSGSVTKTYTVGNVGSGTLHLGDTNGASVVISANGTNAGASDFTFSAPTSTTLGVGTNGSSATFSLTFNPTAAGVRQAEVTIPSDDASSPYTFLVKGTGVAAPIMNVVGDIPSGTNVTAVSIPNGEVAPDPSNGTDLGAAEKANGYTTQTFTIQNTGTAPLLLNSTGAAKIVATGDFSLASAPVIPTAGIPAGGHLDFTVKFKPTDFGLRTGSITIPTNDPSTSPYSFLVQGTAFAAPAIAVTGNSKPVTNGANPGTDVGSDFGSSKTGVGSVVKTFTIKNNGSDLLSFNGSPVVSLSSDFGSDFVLTQDAAPDSLAPGESTTFSITFSPTANAATVETATATINSSDPNGAFVINLKGTATA